VAPNIISELAPTGVLRAGINLSNFLLVTKVNSVGDPEGVAPDLAGEVAMRLGVSIKYVTFKSPGELADAVDKGIWDIGLIGAEPQRAETIAFTSAYAAIEATHLVPSGSPLKAIADVDSEGVRIAVAARSAYGLWLDRNIKHAELIRSKTMLEDARSRSVGWSLIGGSNRGCCNRRGPIRACRRRVPATKTD
jgi:polar amino acid transport system substrate-binding protein